MTPSTTSRWINSSPQQLSLKQFQSAMSAAVVLQRRLGHIACWVLWQNRQVLGCCGSSVSSSYKQLCIHKPQLQSDSAQARDSTSDTPTVIMILLLVTYTVVTTSCRLSEDVVQTAHPDKIFGLAFPANYGEVFATCSAGGIRVWHLAGCRELLRISLPNLDCKCVTFAPVSTAYKRHSAILHECRQVKQQL